MSSTGVSIVMGPEGSDAPGNILNAPTLKRSTDKFQYRLDVRMWSNRVRSFARAGDTRAKGVAGSLGHALYAKMDVTFRKILDSAIATGKLKLDNDDGTALTDDEHKKGVETIMNLVAKDSAIDSIRRLVTMSQKVYNCKREENESYEMFADKFYALAQTYLNHCHSKSTSHEDQNFAMILLENANLAASTYNNIVTYLVAHAKEESETNTNTISVNADYIDCLENEAKSIRDIVSSVENTESNDISNESHMRALKENIENHVSTISNVKKPEQRIDNSYRMNYSISLEKAVSALKDIKTEADQKNVRLEAQSGSEPVKPKKMGAMLSRNGTFNDTRRKYKHQYHPNRRHHHGRGGYNGHKYNRTRSFYDNHWHSDGEYTSDEENDNHREARKHVLNRLGPRKEYKQDGKKQVSFAKHAATKDAPYSKKRKTSTDEESDAEQFFQM